MSLLVPGASESPDSTGSPRHYPSEVGGGGESSFLLGRGWILASLFGLLVILLTEGGSRVGCPVTTGGRWKSKVPSHLAGGRGGTTLCRVLFGWSGETLSKLLLLGRSFSAPRPEGEQPFAGFPLLFVPIGPSSLLVSSPECLGHMQQKENSGTLPQ